MTHRACLLILAAAALAAGCAGATDREAPLVPVTIDFEAGAAGGLPPDFTAALTGAGGPAAWVVREDPTAPSGKKVLVQESADATNYRFPVCIYGKAVARDVAAEVKYKAISGTLDQAGGIVLRYHPDNYYVARANALENNVILFKMVKGKRAKVVEAPAQVKAGVWHTLRFEAKGPHLVIALDGRVVIETDDTTFAGPGQVGLWTKADSVSAFDDLRIEPVR
jgi:hypothetical protein